MSNWRTQPMAGLEEAARLGPCGGAEALVPADHAGMRAAAVRLATVSRGAEQVCHLLRRVDAGEWIGDSGTQFRAVMGEMPRPYEVAARAFGDVARAVEQLADCVQRARETAQLAVERWNEAEAATRRFEHEQQVWREVQPDWDAFEAQTGHRTLACSDEGEWVRAEVRRMVDAAQREVEAANEHALRTIRAATSDAPRDRGWASAARGLRDGVLSPATAAYALTFSPRAGDNWSALKVQATHPWDAPKDAWDAFVDNPDYAAGAALPALLLGGVAARGLKPEAPDVPGGPGGPADTPSPAVMPRVADLSPRSTPADARPPRTAAWIARESQKIAAHSWPKHGIRRKEFPWVDGERGLADYVAGVIRNPTESFELLPGRTIYWDGDKKVMVIQQDEHTGTVYPARKSQYDTQVDNARKQLEQRWEKGDGR